VRRAWLLSIVVTVAVLAAADARAYQHIVAKGETLSQISLRLYGDARWEPVLAAVNGLDAQGGSVILTGMRLTIPAPTFHRATPKDTWPDLAERFYGDRDRRPSRARISRSPRSSPTSWPRETPW
jgi:nucleoid-associated protein YgaU